MKISPLEFTLHPAENRGQGEEGEEGEGSGRA